MQPGKTLDISITYCKYVVEDFSNSHLKMPVYCLSVITMHKGGHTCKLSLQNFIAALRKKQGLSPLLWRIFPNIKDIYNLRQF